MMNRGLVSAMFISGATIALGCGTHVTDGATEDTRRVERRADAISAGEIADITEFPATAALRFGTITVGVTCSGTLIAPSWVLTAAHCVKNVGTEDAAQWTATFGASDLNGGGGEGDVYGVTEVHAHPDWSVSPIKLGFGDVALLKLERAVTGVTPVPIRRTKVPVGTTLSLVGFGKSIAKPTSEDQLSGILRAGTNKTIACASVPSDAQRPKILEERSLCFDSQTAAGPCERDSGGPAYVKGANNKLEVAGIVSGSRDTNLGACGKYSIYAAVNQELAFIDKIAGTKGAGSGGADGKDSGEKGENGEEGNGTSDGGAAPVNTPSSPPGADGGVAAAAPTANTDGGGCTSARIFSTATTTTTVPTSILGLLVVFALRRRRSTREG